MQNLIPKRHSYLHVEVLSAYFLALLNLPFAYNKSIAAIWADNGIFSIISLPISGYDGAAGFQYLFYAIMKISFLYLQQNRADTATIPKLAAMPGVSWNVLLDFSYKIVILINATF